MIQRYNLIAIFDDSFNNILMCKRTTPPYKNLYNLVGGKQENNETSTQAAYRELFEETGITDIKLTHIMNYYYYDDSLKINVFAGIISPTFKLIPEKHPLQWMCITEDFINKNKFGGEGNLQHIINIALRSLRL